MDDATFTYDVHFDGCLDEVQAQTLDEACDIAESLTPQGQRLLLVQGPDGCRDFAEPDASDTPVRAVA